MSDLIRSAGSSRKFHITDLNSLQSSSTGKKGDKIILKKFETLEE